MATVEGKKVMHAAMLCSVDLPARAIVINMKQFNGLYGCCYCESSGTTPPENPLLRFWLPGVHTARTHKSLLENAKKVYQSTSDTVCITNKVLVVSIPPFPHITYITPQQEKGVKGACVLSLHPPFDLVKGAVIDALHGLFLGVVKHLLTLWFDKSKRSQPFYIGDKVC